MSDVGRPCLTAPDYHLLYKVWKSAKINLDMITKDAKSKVITGNQRHAKDVGSPEVQVAVLTERIKQLTGHMKENKHDFHGRRGLLQMVGRRKRLLAYLQRKNFSAYQALIAKLGLRK